MTDKEIIEFLEIHQKRECFRCPNSGTKTICSNALVTAALELIYRQKAEIERLEQENFDRSLTIETWKVEAVKEFAERLIDLINCIPQHHFTLGQVEYDIDNLVKEMVGDSNAT